MDSIANLLDFLYNHIVRVANAQALVDVNFLSDRLLELAIMPDLFVGGT